MHTDRPIVGDPTRLKWLGNQSPNRNPALLLTQELQPTPALPSNKGE